MKHATRHYHVLHKAGEELTYDYSTELLSKGLEHFCKVASTAVEIDDVDKFVNELGKVVLLKEQQISGTKKTYIINTSLGQGNVAYFCKCFAECAYCPSSN